MKGIPASSKVIEAQARFGGYAYRSGRPLAAFARQADLQDEFWLDADGRLLYGRTLANSSVGKRIEDDAMFFERESRKPGAPFFLTITTVDKANTLVTELGP